MWATKYDMEKTKKEHINLIGLKKQDAIDRMKWHDGVHKLSRNLR